MRACIACLACILFASPMMLSANELVRAGDARIRYMGRWEVKPGAATTVNSGSGILFRFQGSRLKGVFELTPSKIHPQVYVSIDGGAKELFALNAPEMDFAPAKLQEGAHTVEIMVKDVYQEVNRWVPPFQSALIFLGFDLGEGGTALDPAPALVGRWSPGALKITFIGDSITEGIRALSMSTAPEGSEGTMTYSYLTSLALEANVTQVGFGAQGLVNRGVGDVPPVEGTYALNFAGSPVDPSFQPDVIVINQGTNDGAVPAAAFQADYLRFLKEIRASYPRARVFAMRPLNGTHGADILAAVAGLNDRRITYVDTAGWLELSNSPDYTEKPHGLHPSLEGHAKAALRLTAVLRDAGVGQLTPTGSSR